MRPLTIGFAPICCVLVVSLASCSRGAAILGGGGGKPAGAKDVVAATIYITQKKPGSDATCVATTVPYTIQISQKADIDWSIVDLCGVTNGYQDEITLTDWKERSGKKCKDSTTVPLTSPGNGGRNIRRGLKADCADLSFTYKIRDKDGNALGDPELEMGQ